jgi:hypothetical protein
VKAFSFSFSFTSEATTMKAASTMPRHGLARNKAGYPKKSEQLVRRGPSLYFRLVLLCQILLLAAELRLNVLKRRDSKGKLGHSMKKTVLNVTPQRKIHMQQVVEQARLREKYVNADSVISVISSNQGPLPIICIINRTYYWISRDGDTGKRTVRTPRFAGFVATLRKHRE